MSLLLVAFLVSLPGLRADELNDVLKARATTPHADTVAALERLHAASPRHAETAYWLASALAEQATDADTLLRVRTLLIDLGKRPPNEVPVWLPTYTFARLLQVEAGEASLLARRAPTLRLREAAAADHGFFQSVLLARTQALESLALAIDEKNLLSRTTTSSAAPGQPAATFTADELREDLYNLKNLLAARWVYVEEKARQTGRTLDDNLAAALGEIAPVMPAPAAQALLTRFIGSLEDGHTWLEFTPPADAAQTPVLPARLIDTTDGVAVAETASDANPLHIGDLLLAIDDQPFETRLAAKMAEANVSTAAARRTAALNRLIRAQPGSATLKATVRRSTETLVLDVPALKAGDNLPWLASRRTPQTWLQGRALQTGVGYVRIASWLPTSPEHSFEALGQQGYDAHWSAEIDRTLAPLRDLPDLIIDVRGNGGGRDQLCSWFASHFTAAPISPYALRYRAPPGTAPGSNVGADGFLNPRLAPAVYPGQTGPLSRARLWVLVDENAYSATDTFLHTLRAQIGPRVTLIGRPSMGGIGGPAFLGTLRNTGGRLTASSCKAFGLDGTLLEGNPARIDYPVRWTRDDLLAGRDPDLEKALALISASASTQVLRDH